MSSYLEQKGRLEQKEDKTFPLPLEKREVACLLSEEEKLDANAPNFNSTLQPLPKPFSDSKQPSAHLSRPIDETAMHCATIGVVIGFALGGLAGGTLGCLIGAVVGFAVGYAVGRCISHFFPKTPSSSRNEKNTATTFMGHDSSQTKSLEVELT